MKLLTKAAAIATMISICGQALAADDYNRTIVSVGTQQLGYFQVKEGLSQACNFGVVYLPDLSQYNARAMMAVLLSAQSRGALINISYDVGSTGYCTATKISAQ
jgi:hypothetical protein